MTRAPLSAVSRKIIGPPIEVRVDLLGRQQMLQLPQARERRGVEGSVGHGDMLEQASHLLGAPLGAPFATEARQDPPHLVECGTVTANVTTVASLFHLAIRGG